MASKDEQILEVAQEVKDASTWLSGPRSAKLFRIGLRLEEIASGSDQPSSGDQPAFNDPLGSPKP